MEYKSLTFQDVLRTEIYLVDINDFSDVNSVYEQYLQEPYPARVTVAVKELPKKASIERSMTACLS